MMQINNNPVTRLRSNYTL